MVIKDKTKALVKDVLGIAVSFLSIVFTVLKAGELKSYFILLFVIVAVTFIAWGFYETVRNFIKVRLLFAICEVVRNFIKVRLLVVIVIIMAAPIPVSKFIEANITPFQLIKTVNYEEQLNEDQGLSKVDRLLPSDYFFNSINNNSDFIREYYSTIPTLILPFNLSLETDPDITFKKYLEIFNCLRDGIDYVYLFKYKDQYCAIKSDNENQKISFSFKTKLCYIYLKYDFKKFLNKALANQESFPKIDYKESLLVLVSKDKKFRKKFKIGDFVDFIDNKHSKNLYDLDSMLKSLKPNILIAQNN